MAGHPVLDSSFESKAELDTSLRWYDDKKLMQRFPNAASTPPLIRRGLQPILSAIAGTDTLPK
jgi:hypothetical protein